MKKHRIPTGWPRRDPCRYRFPIPNAVWNHQLKPIEFVILSYLCYRHTCSKSVLTPALIAKGIHKSVGTVKKYLSALISAGLVTKQYTLAADAFSANNKNFFTLSVEIFLLKLPSSAFMVYAYLLLIEDQRTHTCHPSCNTIATKTGVSKNTALKSISVLEEKGLIAIEPSGYLDKRGMKWKGNNLYTILPIRIAVYKFNQRQLCQLELEAKRQQLCEQQEKYERQHPRAALCATIEAAAAPYQTQANEPLCAIL